MSFLKNIYRKNFCPLGKRLLLEVFDAQPEANYGLVLQESELLEGIQTVYKWWSRGDNAWFEKTERNLRTASEKSTKTIECLKSDFDNLVTLIHQLDQPRLDDFSGILKDGVAFAIAWGTPNDLRHLSIKNPDLGGRHDKLIRAIKSKQWME